MVESTSMTTCSAPGLARTGTQRPCPAQYLCQYPIELADMTEGEGPEERAQRRRCHHPVTEHRPGGS
jgi:hypothetical protein